MDSFLESLKNFEIGKSGIDDVIYKLNNLSTRDTDYEWETIIDNYSKLKYLKNMELQLIDNSLLLTSLRSFMEKIDSVNQYYLREINWLADSTFLEESKKVELILSTSLNFNCPFKKLKYVIDAYDILIPIIEEFRREKHVEMIEDQDFLQKFKKRKMI
jgi:hypothetical protein